MDIQEMVKALRHWKLTRERIVFFAIGFSAVCIYEFLARPIYRPYIYRNQINDFHLADTIGNTLGTVATIFVFLGVFGQNRANNVSFIKIITISVALYELAHPLLGKPIDGWDFAATLLTGGLCLLVYMRVVPGDPETNDGKA